VLLPFFAKPRKGNDHYGPVTYRPKGATQGERALALHPKDSDEQAQARKIEKDELHDEQLRQLYVATTRARHQLIVWIGLDSAGKLANPALVPVFGGPTKSAAPSDAHLSVVQEPPLSEPVPIERGAPATVPVRPWAGRDGWPAWRVTSYSGMSAGRGVELDESPKAGEAATALAALTEGEGASAAPELVSVSPPTAPTPEQLALAPGAALIGGTKTGDLLHAIFEHLDFQAQPPRAKDGASLDELITAQGLRFGLQRRGQQQGTEGRRRGRIPPLPRHGRQRVCRRRVATHPGPQRGLHLPAARRALAGHQQAQRLGGAAGHYELALLRADGHRLHCVCSATALFDAQGARVGSVGVWTDITQRRNTEAALDKTSRDAGKLPPSSGNRRRNLD
jgi:hypothetical protein